MEQSFSKQANSLEVFEWCVRCDRLLVSVLDGCLH